DGARWAVTIIEADQIDLAAVDAALLVEHLEVGGFGATQSGPCRHGSAVRHGLSDFDFGVGDARAVLLGAESGVRRECKQTRCKQCTRYFCHDLPPPDSWKAFRILGKDYARRRSAAM